MNNLTAFGLGDAWPNPAGQTHSRNCSCCKHDPFRKDAQRIKSDIVESNNLVARLMNAFEINPLYFGPEEPNLLKSLHKAQAPESEESDGGDEIIHSVSII